MWWWRDKSLPLPAVATYFPSPFTVWTTLVCKYFCIKQAHQYNFDLQHWLSDFSGLTLWHFASRIDWKIHTIMSKVQVLPTFLPKGLRFCPPNIMFIVIILFTTSTTTTFITALVLFNNYGGHKYETWYPILQSLSWKCPNSTYINRCIFIIAAMLLHVRCVWAMGTLNIKLLVLNVNTSHELLELPVIYDWAS